MSRIDRSRLPDVGEDRAFRLPPINRFRLPNGLRVLYAERRDVPIVTMLLQVSVGSADDPLARPGLAALTADMLDEGSGDRSAIDMAEAVERIGGRFDTDIGPDSTTLGMTTLARFRDRGMGLLADMLLRPRLAAEDFARVRQLRVTRLAQLRDVAPSVADRAFVRTLYGAHPYGHLSLGTEAGLRETTVDQVGAFHRALADPHAATLIVVGAVSADELIESVTEAFGSWRASVQMPPRPVISDATIPASHREVVLVHRADAAQSELRVGQITTTRQTPDYHALLVLNLILGGQFVSRINLKLREEKGYTYGARTGFDLRRGRGPFAVQVSVQTDATADALHDIYNELDAIRTTRPPTDQELMLARTGLTRGYPRNFETVDQIARGMAQIALYDLPDTYYEDFIPRIARVRGEDVVEAATRHLDPSRCAAVVVGDRIKVEPGLDATGFGALRIEEG